MEIRPPSVDHVLDLDVTPANRQERLELMEMRPVLRSLAPFQPLNREDVRATQDEFENFILAELSRDPIQMYKIESKTPNFSFPEELKTLFPPDQDAQEALEVIENHIGNPFYLDNLRVHMNRRRMRDFLEKKYGDDFRTFYSRNAMRTAPLTNSVTFLSFLVPEEYECFHNKLYLLTQRAKRYGSGLSKNPLEEANAIKGDLIEMVYSLLFTV
jgi:hypothetical protein